MFRRERSAVSLCAALVLVGCAASRPHTQSATGSSGSGEPQPRPEIEAFVHEALVGLGRADRSANDTLSEAFTIGPALWSVMLQLDRAKGRAVVEKLGTPSTAVVPMKGKTAKWTMRTFISVNDVTALAAAVTFRDVCVAFGDGTPRAATREERALFYMLTPLEIAGKPLTVVDVEGNRLVAYVENGRLAWLDLLSEYRTSTESPSGGAPR